MIFEYIVDVDFNGIVIFVYPELAKIFGGDIKTGQNILEAFSTTDKGDEVLDEGLALPIMGVDDGSYRVRFFVDEKPSDHDRKILFEDDGFYLNVVGSVYIADMAVFWDWESYTDWKKLEISTGLYRAAVAGVHTYDGIGEVLYGFDICLTSVDEPFSRTVEPRSDSRLV